MKDEGQVLTDDEVQAIIVSHMGHQVGITRLARDPKRVVSIDCLTEASAGKELRIWPATS